jgi:hypothetical protein
LCARGPERASSASLADPPRLALRLAGGSVVIVDPTTGDIARAVDEELGIAWFSAQNGLLFGFDANGLVRVEAREKRARRRRPLNLDPPAAPPIVDVCVSPSGKLLLGRVAFVPGNVVACIDATEDRPVWSRDISAGAPIVLGVAHGHALIAAMNVDGVTIEMRALDDGSPRGTPLRLARVGEDADSFRAIFAHAFAGHTTRLAVQVALLRAGGQLSRHRFDGDAWRTTFDHRIGQRISNEATRPGPLLFARLDTPHGCVIRDATRATTSCFTPRGTAVALVDGIAHSLDDGEHDALHVVDGPTDLVAIAPHPRGVIAIDREDRAYVIAIDDDAREVSS